MLEPKKLGMKPPPACTIRAENRWSRGVWSQPNVQRINEAYKKFPMNLKCRLQSEELILECYPVNEKTMFQSYSRRFWLWMESMN
jgi:hypothetical protein